MDVLTEIDVTYFEEMNDEKLAKLLASIGTKIADAIDQRASSQGTGAFMGTPTVPIHPTPMPARQHGIRRYLTGIAGFAGIIAAFITVALPIYQHEQESYWLKVDKHIEDANKSAMSGFESRLTEETNMLHEMKATLDIVAKATLPSAAPTQLKKLIQSTPPASNQENGAMAELLNVASEYGVDIPSDTTDVIRSRLLKQSQDKPDDLRLMASLINYTTVVELKKAGELQQVITRTNPCITNPPSLVGGDATHIKGDLYKVNPVEFHNCVQVLDGTTWNNVRFTECLLIYRGGGVGLGLIFYTGSLFKIELPEKPALDARTLIGQLFRQPPGTGKLETMER